MRGISHYGKPAGYMKPRSAGRLCWEAIESIRNYGLIVGAPGAAQYLDTFNYRNVVPESVRLHRERVKAAQVEARERRAAEAR